MAPEPVRRIEMWLDDAQWSLMQEDGQLQVGGAKLWFPYFHMFLFQISEIKLTNFSYNRISYSDDSGEHRFELGSFRVKNCVPNTPAIYQVGVVQLEYKLYILYRKFWLHLIQHHVDYELIKMCH